MSGLQNLPIKSHLHKGLTIEGYSRAAVQTYWRIPELRLGFDLGGQPWDFMRTPTFFVSHMHLDHIAALPVYVARRRMMKMDPPTIYVPAGSVESVQQLLNAFQRLDRGRMPCELIAMEADQEISISRELVVTTHATKHTIPSMGFIVWEKRHKLKSEFQSLSGDQIRDLRMSGTEVTEERRTPKVAYLGDSTAAGLDAHPDMYRAEILILEMTFVADEHRSNLIHKMGHMHLSDIAERETKFENELVIASHFSSRYHPRQIQQMVHKAIPGMFDERLLLWL